MKNGQQKPGYNVQIGTENQFVIGFSLHQRAGDPGCLIPHLDLVKKYNRPKPKSVIADAIPVMEAKKITPIVKKQK